MKSVCGGLWTHARFSCNRWNSRRRILSLLVLVTVYCFLSSSLATLYGRKAKNRIHVHASQVTAGSGANEQVKPRFLSTSSARDHQHLEYEAKLDAAMQDLERRALAANGHIQANNTIWQIILGKFTDMNPVSVEFERRNAGWEYSLVTSAWATDFVTSVFSTIPDLINLYQSYPYDVLRADLLRYLLLWYYGGFYADLDVYPARPIRSCPSLEPLFSPSLSTPIPASSLNVSFVVGIELDEPYASPQTIKEWHWTRTYSFIQWTMYAPHRFSPFLRKIVVRVLAHTKQDNSFGLLWRLTSTSDSVLSITGPGIFTESILDLLSESLPDTHPLITASVEADREIGDLVVTSSSGNNQTQPRVTWAPFHRLQDPLWVDASEGNGMGGIGILPVHVWGNGQRHSGAENFQSVHACVNHYFKGTWKKWWWQRLFD
ncbi:hypothetical protein MPDQ_004670 [Monascus purpureus]|uniref:Membrane-bound alpha-1,6-mannosyltransferase Initiation-specific n=1 Tax=Monascus purpureus TaxID=5098 RepID=A0A507QY22_MONPU|nr:hypothetical protein MPDQ_004670 [Monascus purpureus]BDD60767.1 hypothetical protein MAP00_005865 [Monascus purpureus]